MFCGDHHHCGLVRRRCKSVCSGTVDAMQSATIHGTDTVFGKPNPLLLERVTEATGSRKVAVGKDIHARIIAPRMITKRAHC